MAKRSARSTAAKRKVVDWETRNTLAANVRRRMESVFASEPNRPQALANRAGTSLSRVQDILSQTAGASIDTVAKIARALGCSVGELLTPETDAPIFEIMSLWAETDDFGKTNVLHSARAWRAARPRAPAGDDEDVK